MAGETIIVRQGLRGIKGDRGDPGPAGNDGAPGVKGDKGDPSLTVGPNTLALGAGQYPAGNGTTVVASTFATDVAATAAVAAVTPGNGEVVVGGPSGPVKQGRPPVAPTLFVAASNAPAALKAWADYVCDGVDDQVEINAAIAALPAGANNGGRVILSPGTFTVGGAIVVNRNYVGIAGQGWGTWITLANGANTDVIDVGTDANYTNVEVRDLRLNGNRANQTSGHGILLRGSGHKLTRVSIQDATQDNIRVESFDGSNVFEVIFEDVTSVTAGNDCLFLDTTVLNSEFIRVIAHGGLGATKISRYGIYDRGVQNKFLLCHPYFNASHGFFKDTGKQAQIIGGEYENNGGYGVRWVGTPSNGIGGHALLYGNGNTDIGVSGCTDCLVGDVVAYSTASTPIYVSGGSRNRVLGAEVTGGNTLGIRVGDGASRCLVAHCNVHNINSGSASIRVSDSSDNLIAANLCDISISETGTSDRNRFYDNQLVSGSIVTVGAASKLRGNIGYVTENGGVASVANGGTISHGLAKAPTTYSVTATAANRRIAVTAASATTLTISLMDGSGTAITAAENVAWWAEV